jgi:uncharacterized protein YeaO (DUF488 family)
MTTGTKITPALPVRKYYNENEMRFLRMCVRYELELRKTRPVMPTSTLSQKTQKHIRLLARTFVQEIY